MKKGMNYQLSGLLNLRNAIVNQAAQDYLKNKKVLLEHEGTDMSHTKYYDKVNTIRKWFLSDGYKCLELQTDGQWMIDQLDILAKEEYEEENAKRRAIRLSESRSKANA